MGQKQADAADRLTAASILPRLNAWCRICRRLCEYRPRSGRISGAREARALVPGADRETPIEDCVQSGDTLLVQVTRPPWVTRARK